MLRNFYRNVLKTNRIFLIFILSVSILFSSIIYVIIPLFISNEIRYFELIYSVAVYLIFYLGLAIFSIRYIHTRLGLLTTVGTLVFFWFALNEYLIKQELGDIFPYLNVLGWTLIVLTTLAVIPLLINALIQTWSRFPIRQDNHDFKIGILFISLVIIFFISILPWLVLAFFVFEEDFLEYPIYHVIGLVASFILFILLTPGTYGFMRFLHKVFIDFQTAGPTRGTVEKILSELREGKKVLVICMFFIIIGVVPVTIFSSNIELERITITPQDYQVNYAFWGSHYHTRYTQDQLDELNQYNVTIAPYTVGSLTTQQSRDDFVDEMIWWRDNCANVKFLPAVIGIPGSYVWDGAENTTILAKEIVQLIHDNSLTNVKGLSFDWERPVESDLELYGINDAPNRTRHEESIVRWNEFFDWMDVNAPELITSCINYVSMSQDTVDNDFDLHFLQGYNTFEVPLWDEYAPMIYRCGYKGTRPYGIPYNSSISIDTTYDFYTQLKAHVDGVVRVHGNTDRVGVYLGITNCSCYGRDYDIVEFGENLGTGFDVLVRDALICKSFGIKNLTIFILDTVIENGYSMGGVFETYGDDFLDRFDAAVNGPDSTEPFSIPVGNLQTDDILLPDSIHYYLMDYLYNLDTILRFLGISVALIIGSIFIVLKCKKFANQF
jgi:hypothetical protein